MLLKHVAPLVLAAALLLAQAPLAPATASAADFILGTCPAAGNFVINSSMTLEGLTCSHVGSVVVQGNASLILRNTLFTENGNGTTGLVEAAGSSRLQFVNSTLAFTNPSGTLVAIGSSRVAFTGGSKLVNAGVRLSALSELDANGSSSLQITGGKATGVSALVLNSSSLSETGGRFVVDGSRLVIYHSIVSMTNAGTITLSANSTYFVDSSLTASNARTVTLGNQTTLIQSANIAVSSPSFASTIFLGFISTIIANSSVDCEVPSNNAAPNSTISISGGQVTLAQTRLTSSSREFYGYPPNSKSIINVNSTGNISILNSVLLSGQTNQVGTFKQALLTVSAKANTTIVGSALNIGSTRSQVQLSAGSPGTLNFLTLQGSRLETFNNSGSVTLTSTYLVNMRKSVIDAAASAFNPFAYLINASNSAIRVQNITGGLILGNTVGAADFYNTQLSQCYATPCLTSVHSGLYYIFEPLFVRVVTKSSTQPVSGATVTAIDSASGTKSYSANTNSTGWATVEVLAAQNIRSAASTYPSYLVSAQTSGASSYQVLVASAGVAPFTLTVSPAVDPSTLKASTLSASQLASDTNMRSTSYPVNPQTLYKIGTFLTSSYTPYVTIVSNAATLAFANNASGRALTFSTLGQAGATFYFAVVYPRNFTLQALGVLVDGVSTPVQVQGNATYYFTFFNVPSGSHKISLGYVPESVSYNPIQYPKILPGPFTILAIVAIAIVGIAALVLYTRSRDRADAMKKQAG